MNDCSEPDHDGGDEGDDDSLAFETHDPYDYAWTVAAFEAIKDGSMRRGLVSVGGVLRASVVGACPRCEHPFTWSMTLDGVVGAGVLGREVGEREALFRPRTVLLDVFCWCEEGHAGRPPKSKGCGIAFSVEFKEKNV